MCAGHGRGMATAAWVRTRMQVLGMVKHVARQCRQTMTSGCCVIDGGVSGPWKSKVIESRAAIFREVDKFDLWNTQLTIKASNQRGFETHNCYTAAPTRINQAHSIDDPASESKNTSKNTVKMQSEIANIYEVNLN